METVTDVQRSHPWHGIDPVVRESDRIRVFIETIQFDTMKYEMDRSTGLLMVDQPLQMSSLPPYPYGFVPRSYCGPLVAAICEVSSSDQSPMDIFVLSERSILERGVIAEVRLVGGFPVLENGRADDKLIAILARDGVLGGVSDVDGVPIASLDRIIHFLRGDSMSDAVEVGDPYGRARAERLLDAAFEDYRNVFES